jgi:hypothetical protein
MQEIEDMVTCYSDAAEIDVESLPLSIVNSRPWQKLMKTLEYCNCHWKEFKTMAEVDTVKSNCIKIK